MTPIRVLIVDDEKPGRERVRRLLSRDPRVDVTLCSGGAEALDAVDEASEAGRPTQLIFLDVQMPEVDGFAVAAALLRRSVPESMPAIVFVTAHDEYALRAFEAHALDYLLKPFSDERFQASLDRAIRLIRAGDAQILMSRMQALMGAPVTGPASQTPTPVGEVRRKALDKIVVKGASRVRLLPVEQISWIEADGMYVKLHTRDGHVHLHRGLLGTLDASLDARRFVRIHRSAIVNIDVVHELRQDAHGDYVAVLRDETEVRVGRRFRARLQARLGQSL
jgi:two-component system LytT family response regulator